MTLGQHRITIVLNAAQGACHFRHVQFFHKLSNVRCVALIDCPRQKISVDVCDVWVVKYEEFAVSQCSEHVVFIVPCQTLYHRT